MRKILSKALALAVSVTTVFTAVACKEDPQESQGSESQESHAHDFSEWKAIEGIIDCEGGLLYRICSECGKTEERGGMYEDHVWATEYSYDGEYHWLDCTACREVKDKDNHTAYGHDETYHWLNCEVCDEVKEKTVHTYNGEGICTGCGNLTATEGVVYTLSSDGTYATVTGYEGGEPCVVIAAAYENVPVTQIAENAFSDAYLSRVIIPESVTHIGRSAFSNCTDLMGVMIFESVTEIGENAFYGCSDLTIFCEAESQPSGWNENWNSSDRQVFWGHENKKMTEVSQRATPIGDGMLAINDPDRTQIQLNEDLGNMVAPEGFSALTRFDAITEGQWAWGKGKSALWNYNFNNMNLKDYQEVWFAAKIERAYWAFVSGKPSLGSSWVYFYLKQTGKDNLGYILWSIEVSVGGQVYELIEEQNSRTLDKDRPINSIARLLWDEGFGSSDKNGVLIYSEFEDGISFYCTEMLGVKVGA